MGKDSSVPVRQGIADGLPGFYRATVEYNRDPYRLGRVRVRIPQLSGTANATVSTAKVNTSTASSELPWASPGIFFGSGYDMGNFVVPEVGTVVWIAFEEGDMTKPIYFGGVPYAGDAKTYNHLGDSKDTHPDYMGGPWTGGGDYSAPKEIYSARSETQDITRKVLYKSPKGACIYIDDTDGQESVTIVDRAGQTFKMKSPVSAGDNMGNAKSRDLQGALARNQLVTEGVCIEIMTGDTLIKMTPTELILKSPKIRINPSGGVASFI